MGAIASPHSSPNLESFDWDIEGVPPGNLQTVESTNGMASLNAGIYQLSISSEYRPASTTSGPVMVLGADGTFSSGMGNFVLPSSLASNGFSGVTITAVPEPATALLSLLGLAGMATVMRRRTPS